jgi:hypothetical protein
MSGSSYARLYKLLGEVAIVGTIGWNLGGACVDELRSRGIILEGKIRTFQLAHQRNFRVESDHHQHQASTK